MTQTPNPQPPGDRPLQAGGGDGDAQRILCLYVMFIV